MKKGFRLFLLACLAVCLSFTMTTKADAATKVSKVAFSKSSYTITEGKKKIVSVKISPSSQSKKKVTFKSSNSSVVKIKQTANNKIQIIAKKPGKVTITAKVKGTNKKTTCKVTVKKKVVATKKVKISSGTKTMYKGKAQTLKATVTPSNATHKTVKWSSSNKSVATVTSKGKVTAKKAGTVTITATVKGTKVKATYKITVKNPTIAISAQKASLYVGDSKKLTASVKPAGEKVVWSSSNTSVASVSSTGKVTANKAGTATITATIKGTSIKKTCKVTVKNVAAKSVSLSSSSASIYVGATKSLTATVSPSNATNKSIVWDSSDTSVAIVSTGGKVTAKKAGTATITATVSGTSVKATCKVTVKQKSATQAQLSEKFYHTWKGTQYSSTITNKITKNYIYINSTEKSKYSITKSVVNTDGSIWVYTKVEDDPTQYILFKVSSNGKTMTAAYSHDNGKTYSGQEYKFTKVS